MDAAAPDPAENCPQPPDPAVPAEAVPPLVDLFVLGLLIILSMKTLTIWRNSETHAKRREMRTLVLILLGNTWLLFILAMYIAPIF